MNACKLCEGTKINTETGEPCARCVHPFERAGLGKAPFRCTGTYESKFQACQGAPIQPGSSCDYCGTGIMQVYTIISSDGRTFKVGCDCVAKTPDKDLNAEVKRYKAQAVKGRKVAKSKAAKEDRLAKRAQEVAERVAAAAPILERLDVLAASKHEWRSRTAADTAARIRDGMPVSERMAALIEKMWTEAHIVKGHVGTVGKMTDLELIVLGVKYLGAFQIKGTWTVTHKYMWRFKDTSGNSLVWFTSTGPGDFPEIKSVDLGHCKANDYEVPVDYVVKVRGKIKEHGRYNDEPQTVLERCKVARVDVT